jgi:raffinose/stachyose/melibiose transport system permease protein
MFRTLYGYQVQLGDMARGATIATVMFLIILAGVCVYLFLVQRRLRRYQF